ncbi:hypothetical protein [Lactococcus phage Nocturne116]|nr:hypothetical protein [Lactococcus phage Nocturne116]
MIDKILLFLSNGGSVDFDNTPENYEKLFNAISKGSKWLHVDNVLINLSQVTWFKLDEKEEIETEKE